jgi:glycosyltransferase involved in cell wall biosynthesis
MTSKNRLVSIIIPCCNQAHFLAEAIESALRQTYRHFEVIVVDDGSTDGTAEVARRYPTVRYVRQDNQGQGAARNTGLRRSKGSHIVFLDADDRLLPNAVRAGLDCWEAHPQSAFVLGRYRDISHDGSPLRESPHRLPQEDYYLALLAHNCTRMIASKLYQRAVLESLGGFSTSVGGVEDWELDLRITRHFPIQWHSEVVAEYRRHHDSYSRRDASMLRVTVSVLRSQWPYARGNKSHLQAQQAGIRLVQQHYGEPLVSEARGHLLTHRWIRAASGLVVLVRFYPKGFAKAICPGAYLAAVRGVERVRNAAGRVRRQLRGQSTGSIAVSPDPLELPEPRAYGEVTLTWIAERAETVEVHVDAPDGPLFSRTGPSGSQKTGAWVRDGMTFYLQDVSGGLSLTLANTLAVIQAKATVVPAADGLGLRRTRASSDQ